MKGSQVRILSPALKQRQHSLKPEGIVAYFNDCSLPTDKMKRLLFYLMI
ncbi:hypothetical protein [Neobacillus thermocopriae]|nr:hypothetical protein [Neobacillus thermocopriae]